MNILVWILIILFILLAVFFFLLPGYSPCGIVCAGVAALISCYRLLHLISSSHVMLAKVLGTIVACIVCLGIVAAGATFGVIQQAAKTEASDSDYLLVLGAGVDGTAPSPVLQNRIDAAAEYLQQHPDVICILSGGQGEGEDISEAQCMFQQLTAAGIDPQRLWLEDCSTSTGENFRFSLELIETRTGSRPTHLTVLSSEFHLYRAEMVAGKYGLSISTVAAKTDNIGLWINYMVREIAAVWYYTVWGGY